MNAPRIAFLVAALFIAEPVGLRAQQEPPVAPGDRVRVSAPTFTLLATVLASKPDTLVVGVGSSEAPLPIPLASVTKLDVRRRKSKTVKGALIGAGVGFLGVAAMLGAGVEVGVDWEYAFLAGGAALGGFVGWRIKLNRWEAVPLDRLRADVVAHRDPGLSISASMSL